LINGTPPEKEEEGVAPEAAVEVDLKKKALLHSPWVGGQTDRAAERKPIAERWRT